MAGRFLKPVRIITANTREISASNLHERLNLTSEIGLRRALGATKGHIRTQFLAEAILLAAFGGAVGTGIGILATVIYASLRGWMVDVPPAAWAGGLAATLVIGTGAGLLPALRAARMSPTEALWSL